MRTWLILLATSLPVTMVLYRITRKPLRSAAIAAITAAIALQVMGRIELGYFDPFWPIAATVSFAITFCTSLTLALVWRAIERH
jgi:hypothetical protein